MGGADGRRGISPGGAARCLLGVLFLFGGGGGCTESRDFRPLDLEDRAPEPELNAALVARTKEVFLFGFAERSRPEEEARHYLPLLRYLELSTGYRFALHFTPRQSDIVDELGRGEVQFAAVGAVRALEARQRHGAVLLVRNLNDEGKAECRALIVVRPESPLLGLEDLRGRRIAFGHPDSMPGHHIPAIMLEEHGIARADLGGQVFTGSHQRCADALIVGLVDACAIQDLMGRALAREGRARILATSRAFPSGGVVANRDVPPETLAKVRRALLDFQPQGRDAAGLHNWEQTEMALGFSAAQDADYDPLRQRLQRLQDGVAGRGSRP